MGRSPRIHAPHILFHVINRGNGKEKIFLTDNDFLEYLDLLLFYKEKFAIKLYHYVLMLNHVHLLLEPLEEHALSRFMQGVTLAHTRRFNFRNQSVGHVWQGRFKSIPIETDAYFLQCGRYIELNPVRAGTVQHPSSYPWSSYQFYAEGKPNKLLDVYPFYEELGSRSDLRQRLYANYIEEELPKIQDRSTIRFSQKQIYGSDSFIEKMKNEFSFRLLQQRVGRPKKNEKMGLDTILC